MSRSAFRHSTRAAILLAASLLLLSGCRSLMQRTAPPTALAGEQTVPLLIVQGPDGSNLALAAVYIDGQGPFSFALDTGASHSVIDQALAEQLGLPVAGPAVELSGVAATAEGIPVRLRSWRVGDVELPGRTMVSVNLSAPNQRLHLRGLLGSDVLSRFGTVTVDYHRQRLLLRGQG